MSNRKIYFDPSSASPQAFSFPSDVIKYVIKNCNNSAVWLKLIKLCKYFYTKRKTLVFKNTTLDRYGCIIATERSVRNFWENVTDIPCEIFLAGKFDISGPFGILKPKIYKCSLRELIIYGIRIRIEDFEFLVESDILDSFCIRDANITYSDKNIVPLEDVFAALPNVTNFSYEHSSQTDSDRSITAGTMQRMAETSRNRKFLKIELRGFGNLDTIAPDFVLFVQNHAGRHCKIFIKFIPGIPRSFEEALNKMLESWEPQSTKPSIEFWNPHPNIQHGLEQALQNHWDQDEQAHQQNRHRQIQAHQEALRRQHQMQRYNDVLHNEIYDLQQHLYQQRQLLRQEQNDNNRAQMQQNIHAGEQQLSHLRQNRRRLRSNFSGQNQHGNGNHPAANQNAQNQANGNNNQGNA